ASVSYSYSGSDSFGRREREGWCSAVFAPLSNARGATQSPVCVWPVSVLRRAISFPRVAGEIGRSHTITRGHHRAPHRGLLRATGQIRGPDDWNKPFVAVCNSYVDIVPGHVHLREFGTVVKDAVRAAGGVAFEFNTIAVDDGIAMGHEGMRYSLPS